KARYDDEGEPQDEGIEDWSRQQFMLEALEKVVGGKCSKGVEVERGSQNTYQAIMRFSNHETLRSPKVRATLIDSLNYEVVEGFSRYISNFVERWHLESELFN